MVFLHLFVHDCKPKRRDGGNKHTAWVAGGQLWRLVVMPQYLILATGQVMMIAVAAQFK